MIEKQAGQILFLKNGLADLLQSKSISKAAIKDLLDKLDHLPEPVVEGAEMLEDQEELEEPEIEPDEDD